MSSGLERIWKAILAELEKALAQYVINMANASYLATRQRLVIYATIQHRWYNIKVPENFQFSKVWVVNS